MQQLGASYLKAGQLDRVLPLFEETLALRKTKLGPDHRDTLDSMNGLAAAYGVTGQLDRGKKLNEERLAIRRTKLGPDHKDLAQVGFPNQPDRRRVHRRLRIRFGVSA